MSPAICTSSSAASRAADVDPVASMTSISGSSRRARAKMPVASSVARARVAAATSCWPCASRRRAIPGSGRRPSRLARRYAASASANSPRSRWSSAVWYIASPRDVIGLGESLARLPRLGSSGVPCAVELPQLGAVEEAQPAEVHKLWLGLAPGIEGRGPLLRPAHVEDLVARRDHRAVRDARRSPATLRRRSRRP